jgi:predicted PurR-regulated permease PerM
MRDRRLLLVLVGGFALLAAAALWEVLGTVFFAVTVVYVAEPVYDRLRDRGVPRWWAAAATTALAFAVGVVLVVPFGVVLYQRRADAMAFLRSLPESVVVGTDMFTYTIELVTVTAVARNALAALAEGLARAAPVLGIKATVFGFVVFALLVRKREVAAGLSAAVPSRHREVWQALAKRFRDTLVALYVLQAATALATFVVALVVFGAFGYRAPFLLALLSGLLQFLPVVGPSVVVGVVVAYELVLGNVARAVAVGLVAWMAVAWLPDVVVRPRLASRTANLPGSLYFVGFTGGLLTLGMVGIIAGPVVVALLFEALTLLAAETTAYENSLVEGPSE